MINVKLILVDMGFKKNKTLHNTKESFPQKDAAI